MKSHYLFLLVYILGTIDGGSSALRSVRCTTCDLEDNATSGFLQCVGLPSSDTGRDHLQKLKEILGATWDVYTFMKTSMTGMPLLSMEGALELKPGADVLQNEALLQMWVEIKMKPLLQSITKQFLSCLSTKNFSCSAYQTILKELSQHYSELSPTRQQWIYTFFIYPFLSGDGVAGCVNPYESSEDWLMKNFGSFRAMARLNDFSNLNMVFSGLEVLHLLSSSQKAELLLSPEMKNQDNGTLTVVFNSLLTGEPAPSPSGNLTVLPSPYDPYSPQSGLSEIFSGFKTAFTTIGSFAHEFVSFTSQRNLSEIKSTTLTQFLLNFTLAELANLYELTNTSEVSPQFDVTSVEAWYQQVVLPVLRNFWPNEEDLMHQNITLAFHELFFLDNGMNNESSEIQDVCSLTLDKASCGLTDAVENVAHVLHCAARSNLTLTESTVLKLINELTARLNSLMNELSTANFEELLSDFRDIFKEGESPSLTQQHLEDPEYIKLWFRIKLLPLLPDVDPNLLSCLSTKNFSCPAYQILVAALDERTSFTDADPMYGHNIYKYLIYSFLVQRNNSDSQCVSSADRSAEWLMDNFGSFSKFASITDFYELNPYFSGLEALPVLSSKQLAELLLLPLRTPPEKDVVIDRVFDFLLESPQMGRFPEVLLFVVELASEVSPPCNVYRQIFDRLFRAIPSASVDMEPVIWARIDDLINIAPDVCVPANITCPETQINGTNVCSGIDSSDLLSYLNTSTQVSCNFTLEKYACPQLESFTANQLASLIRCDLPGNSSYSKVLWKMLLTHLSSVLDPALDILANVSVDLMGPSAQEVLDVISELRVSLLTDEQLGDSGTIQLWFSDRLSCFLPFASGRFLHCLTNRNISCQSYQQILQVYNYQFGLMSLEQQHVVLKNFVLRFLSAPHSGPGCVSFNSSSEWLRSNLGPFSDLLSVRELLDLNPQFNPLDALQLLTPKQSAELLTLPSLPNKDVLINVLFDFLTESPSQRRLPQFLSYLVMFLQTGNLSCSSYKTLFTRLDEAMSVASSDVASSILSSKSALFKLIPPGCTIYSAECNVTMINETNICMGVNSTSLQLHLDSRTLSGHFCDFAVEEFACASLSALTAQDLAELLKCNRFSSSSGSTAAWKLLLSKASLVLDEALDLLTNSTLDPSSPSVSMILDSIREIRLDIVKLEQRNNITFIQLWFNRRLRPFLPSVSSNFLSCLATKQLQCSTYQNILQILSDVRPQMTPATQTSVYTHFIAVFLTRNNSAGPGCVSFNSSSEWLRSNLGPFSDLLSVRELLDLNPQFNPLDALQLLTPKQSAELLTLPSLPNKDVLINVLFDFLTESPSQRRLPQFLSYLVMFLETGNLSCSSYKTLFTRLDQALPAASSDVASSILSSKAALFKLIPPGCIIYSGECNITMANETNICMGVNSTSLQLHLDSRTLSGHFCDFAVEEFACASLSALTAQDLAELLKCNRFSSSSGSTAAWKLLLSKASLVLDEALDLLTNSILDPSSPSVSMILDSIREIRLDGVSIGSLNNPSFIQLWLNHRLHPFLPAVSSNFLSCLASKALDCNTYQLILQILSEVRPQMVPATQMSVYTHFIRVYLTRNDTADPACRSNINSSVEWLQRNLGGFSVLLSIQDVQRLYPDFSALDALSQLTATQLADVAATPGLLTSPDQVAMVMRLVPDQLLASFFDDFSAAITGHESMLPSPVRSAFLEVVFARANLSYSWVDDSAVSLWLRSRLPPLLINLSPAHVTQYFQILARRNCSIEQQGVEKLNSTISTLSENSQQEIYNHIIQALKGPPSLRCYGNNYNFSFYAFIERSFMGFQFPNLTTSLSLMPPDRKSQLINSIPPSHLGDLLRRPNVVDNEAKLCELYSSYDQTPVFLETESLPAEVGRPTLSCVWPTTLSTSSRSEVNFWFDKSLKNYLVFFTKSLLSSDATNNASCVAFQKLVLVLNRYNFTAADFERQDVFDTISSYLTSANKPRCYNASDPELNSTAWFAEYIGPFIPFLTLEVLQTFGPEEALQVFTVNPLNIALLNHSVLPQNLTDYYTQLVYQQDSNFDPLLLPLLCRCVAPGPAFTQLSAEESMIVLLNLTTVCTNLDPQISAALSSNFGDNIDATVISALGNQSTSISTGQIKMISPETLKNALSVLASVMGWSEGQTKAIIQSLMSSGLFQINSSSSLLTLGTLIMGVPSRVFLSISSSEILTASKHSSVVEHIKSAPNVVQQSFVTQILSVNNNNEMVIQNVPDELATEIPPVLLQGFTVSSSVVTALNKKTWKKQQAELFFNVIAVENATAELGTPDNLTSSVLQGFTCTSVRTISKVQIKKLIRACRRRDQNKVVLEETQLTCMYNYIKGDSDAASFELYPPDMLLYYNYSLVPQSSCRSYFEQLGNANFAVFSSTLSYKRTALFENAKSCLGITNTSLTQDNISVLGNMCCVLDKSYIVNADPSILEKLKACSDLSDAQAAAVQSLLIGGNTSYGAPSTWSDKTLINLEPLPLYLTSAFFENFSKKAKQTFLKNFLNVLKRDGVSRQKRGKMTNEIRNSNRVRSKRATVTECTVGLITQVTISDDTFPFNYDDINQFNSCLTAATVKDNLEAITQKVDQQDYLQVVLSKLRQVYTSTIPEDQLQVLGPASRVATLSDISLWNITQLDTLAALMNSENGAWDPSLAKAIISKYLSVKGNSLGSAELNAIGGPNLCSLDVDVLGNISSQSLKDANALDVSNCTTDKSEKLFNISIQAFVTSRLGTIPVSTYQLQKAYLGGANSDYIKSLVISNVNMDLATFTGINQRIIQGLTVDDVQNLLGTNLPDLKAYENQTVVQSWISSQFQSDLNRLGIGLLGGKAGNATSTSDTSSSASNATTATAPASNGSATATTPANNGSATATPAVTASTTTTSTTSTTISAPASIKTSTTASTKTTTASTTATTKSSTTASTTKGAGARIQADVGLSLLVLIALLISSHQIIM